MSVTFKIGSKSADKFALGSVNRWLEDQEIDHTVSSLITTRRQNYSIEAEKRCSDEPLPGVVCQRKAYNLSGKRLKEIALDTTVTFYHDTDAVAFKLRFSDEYDIRLVDPERIDAT